jgi:hypothetical protein
MFALGTVVFGFGSGPLGSAINAPAATRFGPRAINWVNASYGLGARIGPLATTAALGAGMSWRLDYWAGRRRRCCRLLFASRRAGLVCLANARGAVANGGGATGRPPGPGSPERHRPKLFPAPSSWPA